MRIKNVTVTAFCTFASCSHDTDDNSKILLPVITKFKKKKSKSASECLNLPVLFFAPVHAPFYVLNLSRVFTDF